MGRDRFQSGRERDCNSTGLKICGKFVVTLWITLSNTTYKACFDMRVPCNPLSCVKSNTVFISFGSGYRCNIVKAAKICDFNLILKI